MSLRFRTLLAAATLSLGACGGAADNAASSDTAGRTSTEGAAAVASATSATPTGGASPTAALVVLYNFPRDTAAFERYYNETHIPLLRRHAQEIGIGRAVFMKFDQTVDGKKATHYRKAELWFPSEDAMKKGMETAGFKAVAGDLPKFSTNGQTILISHETNNQ